MSEVATTFVTCSVATRRSSGAFRTQEMEWNDVRGRFDLCDILLGDAAVVECIAHSENGTNGCPRSIRPSRHSMRRRGGRRVLRALRKWNESVSEVDTTFEAIEGATLLSSSALRTQKMV